jgi:outer membrane protein assembly factor BamB
VVAGERVYFVEEAEYKSGEEVHTVLALDLLTGKKVWSQPLKGRAQFFGFVVAVSDGKVWVRNYGVAGAAANYRILDAATGNPVGDMATPVEYQSIVIHGGVLYGVDRWSHSLVNEAGTTTPDSYLVALDAMTGAPLWKSPKQELCELRKTRVTADGTVVLVARYPVAGAKVKEAVVAFRGGR